MTMEEYSNLQMQEELRVFLVPPKLTIPWGGKRPTIINYLSASKC